MCVVRNASEVEMFLEQRNWVDRRALVNKHDILTVMVSFHTREVENTCMWVAQVPLETRTNRERGGEQRGGCGWQKFSQVALAPKCSSSTCSNCCIQGRAKVKVLYQLGNHLGIEGWVRRVF